jgi:hypothetical protein
MSWRLSSTLREEVTGKFHLDGYLTQTSARGSHQLRLMYVMPTGTTSILASTKTIFEELCLWRFCCFRTLLVSCHLVSLAEFVSLVCFVLTIASEMLQLQGNSITGSIPSTIAGLAALGMLRCKLVPVYRPRKSTVPHICRFQNKSILPATACSVSFLENWEPCRLYNASRLMTITSFQRFLLHWAYFRMSSFWI